ncbi:MAG: ABC transporter substrate-binding protein [Clostridiales bacterium]|jgi:peptide/nickel transport system substrate-binding protein|nr:ABC transporter substrate-binding protein [Clostridiales bacterium]
MKKLFSARAITRLALAAAAVAPAAVAAATPAKSRLGFGGRVRGRFGRGLWLAAAIALPAALALLAGCAPGGARAPAGGTPAAQAEASAAAGAGDTGDAAGAGDTGAGNAGGASGSAQAAAAATAAATATTAENPAGGGDSGSGRGGDSGSPARGGEVVIGFPSIPSNYDPLNGFASGVQLLYSALVQTDADMNVVPDLAESWEVSDDALAYTFRLRDGARFSDGSDVTARDVVFSYNTAMANATGIDLSAVQSVAEDGGDVVIALKQPRSVFILTAAQVGIVPERAYGPDFALSPVGSGPFRLAQYDVDQQFILEANEDYYAGAPAIARAVFVKVSGEDTQLLAAKSGEVDITLTSATIAATNAIDGYRLLVEKSLDNMGIAGPVVPDAGETNEYGHRVGNSVTSDAAIRKALAYGLDRQQICDEALSGYAAPAYSENDGMPWSNPESAIEYDPDLALKYLGDAGWEDADGDGIREKGGVRASFPLLYFAGDSVRQAVAMSAANQARDRLGIEILVEGAGEDLGARMFSEPMILAWGSSNPMTTYMLFHSSNAGKDDWYNPENYRNPTVDGYLDAALGAKTLDEAVPHWQKAQWDGATGTSMRGDAPYIFLINKSHLYWAREGLDTGRQKIHAHGDAWPLVANLREWKWID